LVVHTGLCLGGLGKRNRSVLDLCGFANSLIAKGQQAATLK
jgi:hypothetical protein